MTPQLRMIRYDLKNLPKIKLPVGYTVSSYQPGYAKFWTEIISASFEKQPEDFNFHNIMRMDASYRPERVKFITFNDIPVATSSAYHSSDFLPKYGYIHYVGSMPGHTGKKLGFWISLACLHQMRQDNFSGAWLSTDDFRLAAIKTYLNLGFVPLLLHENQRQRWRNVLAELNTPDIEKKFGTILDGKVFSSPQFPLDDFNYPTIITERKRWHNTRKPGRLGKGECDSYADESLYKSLELGSAGIKSDKITAGQCTSATLWFKSGSKTLPEGTEIQFFSHGQAPLGTTKLQVTDATKPGYMTVTNSGSAEVQPKGLVFVITKGELNKGDEVSVHISSFQWTPLADHKELKVMIDIGNDEPTMRLPEPVIIDILPDKEDHLDIFIDATAQLFFYPGCIMCYRQKGFDQSDGQ